MALVHAISTFFNPILYLLAMGVGLGQLVDDGTGSASLDIAYLTFLAPGLLAATAMMTGAGDASWPVMAGIKWRKTYDAILSTPVGVRELVTGHLGWVSVRLLFVRVHGPGEGAADQGADGQGDEEQAAPSDVARSVRGAGHGGDLLRQRAPRPR